MKNRLIDGSQFLVGLLMLFAMLGCEETPPPVPVHRVGTSELPVLPVNEAEGANPDDFQLIQLNDGHDYWFYKDRGGERGYAALTHAPDCEKCRQKNEMALGR